jgi:hypothetical protein
MDNVNVALDGLDNTVMQAVQRDITELGAS